MKLSQSVLTRVRTLDKYKSDEFEMYNTREHGFGSTKIPLRIYRREHSLTAPAPLHSHNFLEIAVVIGGSGTHVVYLPDMDGFSYSLSKGNVCIVAPGEKHAFSFRSGESIRIINILFSPAVVQKSTAVCWDGFNYEEFIQLCSYASVRQKDSLQQILLNPNELEQICRLIEKIEGEFSRKESGYSTMIQLYFSAILTMMLRCYRREIPSAGIEEERSLVAKLLLYLDTHYAQRITLEQLSEMTHFSTRHITRRFKATVGISLNQYLLNQRIASAKSLLVTTDKKVSEIAMESGFDNSAYFCQQFKRETGHTPNAYRRLSQL